MAVRHGYGKIAGADALVFAYDTGDTYNSYKGEPTVNIIDGGSNVAKAITGCFQFGNHASSNGSETANVDFSNTYAKRKNVLRVTNTNGIGYSMINQRMSSNATSGTSYTYSFDYKVLAYDGGTWTPTVGVYGDGYKVPNSSYTGTNYAYQYRPLPDGWIRFVFTYTADYAGRNTYRSNMNTNDTTPFDILFDNFQIEENSHVTPFTTGTRSATQGLLDLTGNRSIDLGNVNFDSNARKIFDGTDDTIEITTATEIIDSDYTVETVVKKDTTGVQEGILSDYQYSWWIFKITSANKAYIVHKWNNSTPVAVTGATTIGTDYTHITVTFSKTDGMKLYVNGELDGTNSSTLPFILAGRGPRYIGHLREGAPGSPASFFNGQIPVLKISTGALTAQEVRNNFNFYKGRFGI